MKSAEELITDLTFAILESNQDMIAAAMKAIQERIHVGDLLKADSPFCENCKEENCIVSSDNTCAMIRKYLVAEGK